MGIYAPPPTPPPSSAARARPSPTCGALGGCSAGPGPCRSVRRGCRTPGSCPRRPRAGRGCLRVGGAGRPEPSRWSAASSYAPWAKASIPFERGRVTSVARAFPSAAWSLSPAIMRPISSVYPPAANAEGGVGISEGWAGFFGGWVGRSRGLLPRGRADRRRISSCAR